jgi:antitoxin (DNA-binding transcriptional repressor) of toxin-antitoxin stability system
MKTYNIYDAKTNLSKIIKEVQAGKEVSIAKNGEPLIDLKLHQPKKNKIKFGFWTGMVDIKDEDLVGIDPEIQELVYGKDWDK